MKLLKGCSAVASLSRFVLFALLASLAGVALATPLAAQTPTLTTISPGNVVRANGNTVLVTLTGTNLDGPNLAIDTGGSDITAGAIQIVNPTTVTAGFTISATAAAGTSNISVSTNNGTSNSVPFVVSLPAAPTLTAITPTIGPLAGTVQVLLTGTNFNVGGFFIDAGPGIIVFPINVASATTATATFTIGLNATLGARDVTVTTNGGVSNTFPFTVLPEKPALTGITPSTGLQGASVPVTLTGANFIAGNFLVSVLGNTVSVSAVVVLSPNLATATLDIAPNAPFGVKTVTVISTVTTSQVSNSLPFSVVPITPTLTSINPSAGKRGGAAFLATFTGTNFAAGLTTVTAGAGITVGPVTVIGTTSATTQLTIALGAAEGDRSIVVGTTGGTSNAVTFTVQPPPPPTLVGINPLVASQGASVPFTFGGTNFHLGGFTINPGPDITVSGNPVVNGAGTQATATLVIGLAAAQGLSDITVSTAGGPSNTLQFTVRPPAPTLTSITPSPGIQGSSDTVTLTGTNFDSGGFAVIVNLTSVTVSNAIVLNGTTATATFTIDPVLRAPFNRNVTVSTAGGSSGIVVFQSVPPLATFTDVSPTSGRRGTTTTVTLTGTNFVTGAGATIISAGSGITTSALSIISPTLATANLIINVNSTEGPRNIAVVTGGGTSTPLTFTVDPPGTPTLSSITPSSGAQGTSVPITLIGTNYSTGLQIRPLLTGTSTPDPTITVTALTFGSTSGIATANLVITALSTAGIHDIVVVTTAGGTSNALQFTVDPPAIPIITAVISSYNVTKTQFLTAFNPPEAARGRTPALPTSVPITIQGSNFATIPNGNRVVVGGVGSGITVATAFTTANVAGVIELRGTLSISSATVEGIKGLTVNTDVGTSDVYSPFTVKPPIPIITAITPASASAGDLFVPVTITGFNFTTNPSAGVFVTIRTTGGVCCGLTVADTGETFGLGTQTGGVPDFGPVQLIDDNTIITSFKVDAGAAAGVRLIKVSSDSGQSAGGTAGIDFVNFTVVTSPSPTLTRLTPNQIAFDATSVQVTLSGTNFDKGDPGTLTVTALGGTSSLGLTFGAPTVVTGYTATMQVDIDPGTVVKGQRVLNVATSLGSTNLNNGLNILNGIPVVTSIFPDHGGQGKTVPVTVFGSNFLPGTGGTALALQLGSGITVGALVVDTAGTQATGTLTITPSAANPTSVAAAGIRSMTVTTGAGTSNVFPFTVDPAPVPTLTSVNPIAGALSGNTPITLTGTGLIPGIIVSPGPDISRGAVTVNNLGLTAGLTLTIAGTAALGDRTITVNTVGGTSNTVTFKVIAFPLPTLTLLNPSQAGQGASSLPVTISGNNFSGGNFAVGSSATGITFGSIVVVSNLTATMTVDVAADAAQGAHPLFVITDSGSSATRNFTVLQPVPVITSLSPNTGLQGAIVPVTFTGVNFAAGMTIQPGANITATSIVVTGTTSATANLTIAAAAVLGSRAITVTTASGVSASTNFTVQAPQTPTITGISPAGGRQGQSTPITLTGTNFVSGLAIRPLLAGTQTLDTNFTVSPIVLASSTQATATLTVNIKAALGTRDVTVTTLAGTSNSQTYTVLPPNPPTLSSVFPPNGAVGTSVTVTLTGTNLSPSGFAVNVGPDISLSGFTANGVSATATLVIGPAAAVGARSLSVATVSGSSTNLIFTVTPPALTYTSITPNTVLQGAQSLPVTLTGTNFDEGGVTLNITNIPPSNITVTAVDVVSSTQATALLNITSLTPVKSYATFITTNFATSGTVDFAILPPSPLLTGITPSSGTQGVTVPVTLTGNNFIAAAGSQVNITGAGVTVSGVVVSSGTTIRANLIIDPAASIGVRVLTVSTSGGTTAGTNFTVLAAPTPTLTGIIPTFGSQGGGVPVTLQGTNFISDTAINAGAGITFGTLSVNAALTQATTTFIIAPSAALGPRDVIVTTAGGVSSAVTFTVAPPLAPTLISLAPANGVQGASVPVTLIGTNFIAGFTLTVDADVEIGVTNINIVSSSTVTATFGVSATAAAGTHLVTVTTPSGSSSAAPFVVVPFGSPTWTQLFPVGGPPLGRILGATGYDATTSQLIIFGGQNGAATTNLGDLWSLNLAASPPSWTQLTPAGTGPGVNKGPYNVYDQVNSRLTVFGGVVSPTANTTCSNNLYVLSNANSVGGTPTWTQLNPTGTIPPVRRDGAAVYDAALNRMIIFGGNTCASGAGQGFNDAYVLTNANGLGGTPDWTQLAPTGTPPQPLRLISTVYDPGSNRLIVFGGVNEGSTTVFADVWILTNANGLGGTPAWIQLSPAGSSPVARIQQAALYDPANNQMTIYAGSTSTTAAAGSELNDTWILSNANGLGGTPTWTRLNPVGSIPPNRRAPLSSYDQAANRLLVFGGSGSAAGVATYLNDVWQLSDANGVLPVLPTLTSINPVSGTRGTSVPMTLTGTDFINGLQVDAGSNITASSIVVVSPTSATATLAIGSGAALGARNITVITAGGTSNAATFTVQAPPAPTLSSLSPSIAVQGTTIPVTLTGTNFLAGMSIDAGLNINVTSINVVSGTTATATFAIGAIATLGDRCVTVTTGGGTTGCVTFTVVPAVPTLSSVSPAGGAQGANVNITLTGTNFVGGLTIDAGANITPSNIVVVNGTTVTATLAIGAGAAAGTRNITVTTPGGTSGPVPFNISSSSPTLSSVNPSSGLQGSSVNVTLTGANFVSGLTIDAGANITPNSIVVVNVTTVTATLVIGPSAATGGRNLTVTTPGGTSSAITFTVNAPAVTLSSVTPTTGVQGTSVPVTLTGTNFTDPLTVNAGANITANSIVIVNTNTATATLDIAAGAALGSRNLAVTTPAGTSNNVAFTVLPPTPTLSSVSPASGGQGVSVPVTLTGTNFVSGLTVNAGASITPSSIVVVNGTTATATLGIGAGAALGVRTITVATSGGTSNTVNFTVLPPPPTLSSVNPATGVQGTSVPVTLTGTNFTAPLTIDAGTNITPNSILVVNGTTVTATLDVGVAAVLGARNITVTTVDGTSNASTYTVLPPAPTLSSMSPTLGVQGTSVPVTFTGTDFVSGLTVNAGASITPSSIVVVNGTTATATLAIGASAALGVRNITIATAGGTSAGVSFTVLPPTPTLSSVSPASGAQGASIPVTLTGTNLVSGLTVNSDVSITPSSIVVVNGTTVTATLAVDAASTLGVHSITVATAGGTSNAINFTVLPPGPTLSSVTPASAVQGTSVPVTFTGANFVAPLAVGAGSNITASSIVVVDGTTATATLAIGASAALGNRNITVATSGGSSNAITFTVLPPTPTLSSVTPGTGAQGLNVPITLTGTNLVAGLTVDAGANITANSIVIVNGTTATATLAVQAGAALGGRTITVATAGGTSNSIAFTVVPPPPTLSSVTPATGVQNTSVPVTLTGTNFISGLTVNPGVGITANSVVVVGPTSATATLVVDVGATLGGRSLTVATVDGTSNAVTFTVLPPTPTLSSVSPANGVQGTNRAVTLIGTNFVAGLTVDAGANITVSSIVVVNLTTATATLAVGGTATLGDRNLTVATAGGTSNAVTFTVLPPTPTLSSVKPGSVVQGTITPITLSGANFVAGMTVNAGANIVSGSIVIVSGATATATLDTAAGAALGGRSFTVTTAGGTSNAVTLTVLPPGPTLSSVSPAIGVQGVSVPVTLIGTNFVAGLAVDAGTNVSVSSIAFVNSTTATATLALAVNAALGDRTITIATAGGSSNTVTFTVLPPTPTLSSISPTTGVQGANVPVTLVGSSFVSGLTVNAGANIVVNSVVVVSGTSVTATFALGSGASLGVRSITVTTAGGTSNSANFNLLPPPPTLTSVSPSTGVLGTSLPVTLTGTNFVTGLIVDAGANITSSSIIIVDPTTVTATLAIGTNAALGVRGIKVVTAGGSSTLASSFTVISSDLTVTSSHLGNFGVGFSENYSVTVRNVGPAATTGTYTITDTLPSGMTLVSATGGGWSCTSTVGTTFVTCSSSAVLLTGESAPVVTITVAVGAAAAPGVTHTVKVSGGGDGIASNNTSTDATFVMATPVPGFLFTPQALVAGQQATLGLTLSAAFPHDISGTLTMTFNSNAANPLFDPATQFENGTRQAFFTIPANTLEAQFGPNPPGPIAFQTGTVSGTLVFSGTLTAGTVSSTFAPAVGVGNLTIPRLPPVIQSLTGVAATGGVILELELTSTMREVTSVTLQFVTIPTVRLSCGGLEGCSVSGSSITLNVKQLFDNWYANDQTFGGISVLRLPLSFGGTTSLFGTIDVTLRNSSGASNRMIFTLP